MHGFRLACLLLLVSGSVRAAPERHHYQESTGNRITLFEWSAERQADEIRIVANEPTRRFLTQCDTASATSAWQVIDTQYDIQVQRHGDRLILHGHRDGQAINREMDLDDAPWYQSLSYSLRAWLAGKTDRIAFWTLRPDTLEAVKLRAQRMGPETLETRTGTLQAIRVRIRADGLFAPFWKGDYWFRASDHVFIKFQAVNGLPGTPETTIELLPEADAAQVPGTQSNL